LNLIEGLWGWLKSDVVNNVFFSSVREIRKAVRGFIDSIAKVPELVINGLYVQMYILY